MGGGTPFGFGSREWLGDTPASEAAPSEEELETKTKASCDDCGNKTFEMVLVGEFVDAVCEECGRPYGNDFKEITEEPDN